MTDGERKWLCININDNLMFNLNIIIMLYCVTAYHPLYVKIPEYMEIAILAKLGDVF